MDVRDNMKTSISSSAENLAYKERMPTFSYTHLPVPGRAEINFGKILKEHFQGYRDALIISSQAGHELSLIHIYKYNPLM